jgi:hypothetical protein
MRKHPSRLPDPHLGTIWDHFSPICAIFRPIQTILTKEDLSQTFRPFWVISDHYETITDHLGPLLTTLHHFRLFEVILCHLESFGTIFGYLDFFVAIEITSSHFRRFEIVLEPVLTILDRFRPFWSISDHFEPLRV